MNESPLALLNKHFDMALDAEDGITRLRELILTLAMQGKLVPQDPQDQPASELLKKIEAEKKRLVKEGKIKAPKALPEIGPEDVPYEVPTGWEWVRLADISTKIHYGYTASANHDLKEVRLLRITDIQDNIVEWNTVPGCDVAKEEISQYLLEPNDILIARTGGTVGKSYLVQNITVNAVFASYLIRVVSSKSIYVKYLKYFLETKEYWKQLYEACSGTGQPNVNGTSLSELLLTLPPLSEQKRIVAKIDQLMATCDALEAQRDAKQKMRVNVHTSAIRALLDSPNAEEGSGAWAFLEEHFGDLYGVKENVAELRKAILQLAVMGRLVKQDPQDQPASELLKDIEAEKKRLVKEGKIKAPKALAEIGPEDIPYEVPQGWEWVRLGEISSAVDYGTSIKTSDDSSKIPVFRMGNIVNGKLLHEGFKYIEKDIDDLPKLFLKNNDLLFNRTNSYELVGKTAIYLGKDDTSTFASYLIRVGLHKSFVYSHYINNAMNAPYYRLTQIDPEIVQQCGQANFNGTKLSWTKIPLPPLAEQKRIVAKIDQLMELCDRLEMGIEEAAQKRSAVLGAVLAGV